MDKVEARGLWEASYAQGSNVFDDEVESRARVTAMEF